MMSHGCAINSYACSRFYDYDGLRIMRRLLNGEVIDIFMEFSGKLLYFSKFFAFYLRYFNVIPIWLRPFVEYRMIY